MTNGWEKKRLGDVATLKRGYDLPRRERVSGEFPLASSSGIIDSHNEPAVNGPGVVTGRSGSIGNVFFVEEDFWPLNTVLYVQDFHGNDPRFIYYLLRKFDLKRFASGAGVPTLNRNFVHGELVSVPPLAEQQRIVGILDEAFECIATARANAEQNLANARALFESHLNAVFTQRGEGWVEMQLSEVCTLVNGRAYKKAEMLDEGKYPLLRVGNFFTNKTWYYSDLELDPDKYCDTGDLLYAWSASFGPRIWEGGKVIYHYHIWKVIPNPEVIKKRYLLHLLEWDVDQIKQAHGTGTTMMHVSKGSMEQRIVPIAPLKEQSGIIEQLDDLREETQRLEAIYQQKIDALDELKQTLLHQAFTGHL